MPALLKPKQWITSTLSMNLRQHPGGAAALLSATLPDSAVGLAWLGQAGFVLRFDGRRFLIDPYLSDHLARKYTGTEFPHTRMMAAPINFKSVRDLDLVLCTHRHSDHMDPGALPALAANNPRCRFVVPRAELEAALAIGLDAGRIVAASAGESIQRNIFDNDDDCEREAGARFFEILPIPAAHEALKTDAAGEHYFLGYILRLGKLTIYHSGDCVVYKGLDEMLREQRVDLALLPVNGRSERLTSRGIVGNMNFAEARDLCLAAGIPAMIPHHFGLFDFNTVDPAELQKQIERIPPGKLTCVLPRADRFYVM